MEWGNSDDRGTEAELAEACDRFGDEGAVNGIRCKGKEWSERQDVQRRLRGSGWHPISLPTGSRVTGSFRRY